MSDDKHIEPAELTEDQQHRIFLKDLMLNRSESFCMLPWIHIHTDPSGLGAPCCIGESLKGEGIGHSNDHSLVDLVNSPKMKRLRLDMLKGIKNPECSLCHHQEKHGGNSFRKDCNKKYEHHFDEVVKTTDMNNGRITNFRMRYFDIRFSNICNFKCRTCGSHFSSQWEQEDLKSKEATGQPHYAIELTKGNTPEFVRDIRNQVKNLETAYFAGGEPLITDEHYVLIDEMIKQKRTDIQLVYNSNISNLRYKKRDIFKLWDKFEKVVMVSASIDHYGDRAEYIRHGTKWKTVEKNLAKLCESERVSLTVNTVFSVFNALTISHFYKFMIDNHYYLPTSQPWSLYCLEQPQEYSIAILSPGHRLQVIQQLRLAIQYMQDLEFSAVHTQPLEQAIKWINNLGECTWETHKTRFREEVTRIDTIRGESFVDMFPELSYLLKPVKTLAP